MTEIDYSQYNLQELYEARFNVNMQKYPRNAELIEHWIKVREGEIPPEPPEPERIIDSIPELEDTTDPIQKKPAAPEYIQYSNSTKTFTSPRGRIGRSTYWMGNFALAFMTLAGKRLIMPVNVKLYLGVSVALIIPALMLAIKRSHDRNKSGWFTILFFVPIVSFWPMVELGFLKGTTGTNKYGNDPLSRGKRLNTRINADGN